MSSRARVCFGLVAALALLSCGRAPAAPAKGVVGRFVDPDGKGVMEFLPGGLFLQTGEEVRGGITRPWVHAGSYQSWTDHDPGVLVYRSTRVGPARGGWEWGGLWTLDGKGRRLFLTKDSMDTVLTRADPEVPLAPPELIGLWKRAGPVPADHAEMGILFTPGGLEVVVGRKPRWDAAAVPDCDAWLCIAARYEVGEGQVLTETDLLSPSPRRRTRTFELRPPELTIRQEGRESLVYRRASGGIPLTNHQFDLDAWTKLD